MSSSLHSAPPRPITARAAENGLWLSIYISVLALSMGFSTAFPPAQLVLWVGSIAMPFVVYRLLLRSAVATGGNLSFPELWAEGIASFFLGTLIPALIVYLCLRFAVPTFVSDTLSEAATQFAAIGTPEADSLSQMLSEIVAKGKTPTAVDMAAQLISFNIIAGTSLSLIMAVIVKARTYRRRRVTTKD